MRPVDHFSWSAGGWTKKGRKAHSVNGQTEVLETISHDHLDDLVEAMTLLRRWEWLPAEWSCGLSRFFVAHVVAQAHGVNARTLETGC